MKCLTNLDMVKNQIINGVIQKVTADPTTKLVEGWIIYNTTDKKFKYYDGESWVSISGGSGSSGGGTSVDIVTELTASSTNTKVPGAKAVYDFVKENTTVNSVDAGVVVKTETGFESKTIDTEVTENSENLINSGAVKSYVDSKIAANDAMVFKGTLSSEAVITSSDEAINGSKLTELTQYKNGWTFIAAEPIGNTVLLVGKIEAGDMIIVSGDETSYLAENISVVQANIDGAVTGPDSSVNDTIVLFDGTSGKLIKSSEITKAQLLAALEYTINLEAEETATDVVLQSSNTEDSTVVKPGQTVKAVLKDSGVTAGNYGNNEGVLNGEVDDKDSFTVPEITVDSKGRVTFAKNTTVRLNLESKATRSDFNNPKLVADEEGNCTWTIELAHTEMPVITLYEVATKEVVLADVKDNAAADEIIVTFRNQTEIAAGTYHATVIA